MGVRVHGFNSFFEVHYNHRCECVELKVWASLLMRCVGKLRESHRLSKFVWVSVTSRAKGEGSLDFWL